MSGELLKRIFSSFILIPFSIFIILMGSFYFNVFLLICLIISIYEWNNMSKKLLLKIFGFFFLILSFFSIYKLRNDFDGEYLLVFFILLICVSTDLGGFIFGKIFKGPRLTKISPNKTYSGVVGSYILSFILALFYYLKLKSFYLDKSIFQIIVIIFLVSTVSQIGDLLLSYFKRLSNIKDTGKIIPGHGGLLDRIDGMIFAFPFAYLIFKINLFKYF